MKTLVFFLCIILLQLIDVRADEPHTFCGRTVDGWIAVLRDRSSRERGRAAGMLGQFGPEAIGAVPDLIDTVRQSQF
jgi:hypothetical protein